MFEKKQNKSIPYHPCMVYVYIYMYVCMWVYLPTFGSFFPGNIQQKHMDPIYYRNPKKLFAVIPKIAVIQ